MVIEDEEVVQIQKELVDLNIGVKAIIQDMLLLKTSTQTLQELNSEGRAKINGIKICIENLYKLAKQNADTQLMSDVETHRNELTTTLKDFRRSNIIAMSAIEKSKKDELLSADDDDDTSSGLPKKSQVRRRNTVDKGNIVKMSSNVTDRLLSISRHLAQTTERSANTLETLAMSSSNVWGTRDELENTSATIAQSGKLLKKYGRREFTDKILVFFAFAFFVACVLYIVQKRLF
ncbi:vesicle transport protein SEC20-like [Ctenocephalides felis]|uniref:vesicle transport protein SEC20-like n=1 Tax=Ctenocephalides felis TaxID=7515 RepID=UPI000E6E31B4|nr:vesicle transport protein SEC20-like [Ctenocephalides felis]